MAVIRLLFVLLSAFLLLVTDVVDADDYAVYCDDSGSGGSDAATVRALVKDLKEKVPDKPHQQYCNVLTSSSSGLQVFGYGHCTTSGGSEDSTSACRDCLSAAGDALIGRCEASTGAAGQVWGPTALCYIKSGTSSCAPYIIH